MRTGAFINLPFPMRTYHYDTMHMIRHDHIFIQTDLGAMRWNLRPEPVGGLADGRKDFKTPNRSDFGFLNLENKNLMPGY